MGVRLKLGQRLIRAVTLHVESTEFTVTLKKRSSGSLVEMSTHCSVVGGGLEGDSGRVDVSEIGSVGHHQTALVGVS